MESMPYLLDALGRLPPALKKEVAVVMRQASAFNEVTRARSLELDLAIEADPELLPSEIFREIAQRKFLSQWLPRAFGGGGYSSFSMLPFNEELGSGCLAFANLIGAHYVGISLLSATGNLRLLRFITSEIVAAEKNGEACFLSTAVTEPHAGSDLEDHLLVDRAHVSCIATRVSGGYQLRGSKVFISNSRFAKWHVVVAYADAKDPRYSPVVLLVKGDSKGLSLGRQERKMGQHACPANELVFEDCFVPDDLVAFAPAQFSDVKDYRTYCSFLIDDVLPMSRAGVGALSTGAARSAFEIAFSHSLRLKHENNLFVNQEWVQARLGEMQANVLIARLAYWEANVAAALTGPYSDLLKPANFRFERMIPAWLATAILGPMLASEKTIQQFRKKRLRSAEKNPPKDLLGLAAFAKATGSDYALKNIRIAMDLLGTHGFRQDQGLEKMLRDAKLLQIYEGTNALNLMNVFSELTPPHSEVRIFEA